VPLRAVRPCRNSASTIWRVDVSIQTGRTGDYASPPTLEDGHQRIHFTREEIPRLLGMFGFIAALHVIGWGLFTHYNSIPLILNTRGSDNSLVYAGAGVLAYTFGLRHAFDADHISAVDDTTRYLLQKGKRRWGWASSSLWGTRPSCSGLSPHWPSSPRGRRVSRRRSKAPAASSAPSCRACSCTSSRR